MDTEKVMSFCHCRFYHQKLGHKYFEEEAQNSNDWTHQPALPQQAQVLVWAQWTLDSTPVDCYH
jgi:hypothetical protein